MAIIRNITTIGSNQNNTKSIESSINNSDNNNNKNNENYNGNKITVNLRVLVGDYGCGTGGGSNCTIC